MTDNSKKLLKSFVLDIVKVFPEYEKRLSKSYSKILNEEDDCDDILVNFFENVDEISKQLSENDFTIFEKDPIILDNVSFKLIWGSNISNETRNNVWRYLQTFCVYKINSKQGKEDVEDVLNSIKQNEKVSDKGTLKNMKMLKKLTESLNSNVVMELLSEKKGEAQPDIKDVKMDYKNIKGMEDILENSSIGKIAKEVSEELNIESMIGEGGGIENLMNGENIMNIFKSISEKIDNNPNDNIMEEAMNLSKNMKDNPLFSSLMSTMGQGLSHMNTGGGGMSTYPDNRMVQLSNTHDGTATKKRLQKKLQEKKEGKIDVNKKE